MRIFFCFILICSSFPTKAQLKDKFKSGNWYLYWGWNQSWYSGSDIQFMGENYNFTLNGVVASDRQSPFDAQTYFSPSTFTIPQYNYRIGYHLQNNWDVSIGMDHMKYVVTVNQITSIDGHINDDESVYHGTYHSEQLLLSPDFLQFEHTDGLNVANIELRKHQQLTSKEPWSMTYLCGAGLGLVIPKTNTILLSKDRYDEFHLSGYGLSVCLGTQFNYNNFFIQSELKTGWINMPYIRTTQYEVDRASQSFFYTQVNLVFGVYFYMSK